MLPSSSSLPSILYAVLEDFSTLASPVFEAAALPTTSADARRTPHLGRLAQRGVTFQRVYSQAPICNPSRTSFLTGRRPQTTRVFSNDDGNFPDLPTLVDFIRGADPAAAVVCGGKIFHVACDKQPRGFAVGAAQLRAEPATFAASDAHLRNVSNNGNRYPALHATMHSQPAVGRTNDQDKTRAAIRLMAHYALARERRFFVAVGLASTHVQGSSICTPAAATIEGGAPVTTTRLAPNRATEVDPPLVTWPNWDLNRFDVGWKWMRAAIGDYYACATHIDAQIGALLDALDVLYLTPTTAFVVQGDHGFSLGRHGRWSKYHLYEDATRVPLVMMVPGGARGRVVSDVVESLDVMPTILDLWGVPTTMPKRARSSRTSYALGEGGGSAALDGTSLLPYLAERPAPPAPAGLRPTYARSELREWMVIHRANDTLLPGARPMRMVGRGAQLYVRTTRYAYVAYLKPRCDCAPGLLLVDEQLFDHSTDSGEATNLAYNPAHLATRDQLLALVRRDWKIDVAGNSPRPDRAARIALLTQLAGCFNRSAPKCPSSSTGPLVGELR